jgi:hypothetical protein
VFRDDDAIHRAACHRFADRDRSRIDGSDLVHHAAHVRVERQVQRAQQQLAVGRLRRGRCFEAEMVCSGSAGRPGGKDDATIRQWALRHGGTCVE